MNCSECKHIERMGSVLYCTMYHLPIRLNKNCDKFEQYVEEEKE